MLACCCNRKPGRQRWDRLILSTSSKKQVSITQTIPDCPSRIKPWVPDVLLTKQSAPDASQPGLTAKSYRILWEKEQLSFDWTSLPETLPLPCHFLLHTLTIVAFRFPTLQFPNPVFGHQKQGSLFRTEKAAKYKNQSSKIPLWYSANKIPGFCLQVSNIPALFILYVDKKCDTYCNN